MEEIKKSIILALKDVELIELERVLLDDDQDGALKFLKKHIKGKAREALDRKSQCRHSFE